MSRPHTSASRAAKALNDNRAAVLLLAAVVLGSILVPGFANPKNFRTILHGVSLTAITGIGFTIILVLGHIDLSVGATIMLSGMTVLALHTVWGWSWGASIAVAILSGAVVGFLNGLLVVKARIHSFIVTLGMQKVVLGLMQMIGGGTNMYLEDFHFPDIINGEVIPLVTLNFLIALLLVIAFTLFMSRTRFGKNLFIIGGNPRTAVAAGIATGRYLITGFVLSGCLAAVGGVAYAIGFGTMPTEEGLAGTTLMRVLSGTIIGGALLSGGRGSVLKSFFALLMLTTLFNLLGCLGYSIQLQLVVNGIIFAVVVVYESYEILRNNLAKGQRVGLLRENLERAAADAGSSRNLRGGSEGR